MKLEEREIVMIRGALFIATDEFTLMNAAKYIKGKNNLPLSNIVNSLFDINYQGNDMKVTFFKKEEITSEMCIEYTQYCDRFTLEAREQYTDNGEPYNIIMVTMFISVE